MPVLLPAPAPLCARIQTNSGYNIHFAGASEPFAAYGHTVSTVSLHRKHREPRIGNLAKRLSNVTNYLYISHNAVRASRDELHCWQQVAPEACINNAATRF